MYLLIFILNVPDLQESLRTLGEFSNVTIVEAMSEVENDNSSLSPSNSEAEFS